MGELITVFVLARNRVNFASKMIESLANQKNKNFCLVLSDNSEPNLGTLCELAKQCEHQFEKFDYRLRDGTIDLWNHLKVCVEECGTNYINILHDDDLVNDDYMDWIISTVKANPDIAAIAPNAYKINEEGSVTGRMRHSNLAIELKKIDDLYNSYFSPKSSGIACFPFYTYKVDVLKTALNLPLTCGYYSDVEILSRIVSKAPIYWSEKIVTKYRMHGDNMSKLENIVDRHSLGEHIKKTATKKTISIYKSWLIYSLIITNLKNKKQTYSSLIRDIKNLNPTILEISKSIINLIKVYGKYKIKN
jgi:hypothetical protein